MTNNSLHNLNNILKRNKYIWRKTEKDELSLFFFYSKLFTNTNTIIAYKSTIWVLI